MLDTAPYLREAIETVQALPQPPDAVVVTGDLADFGQSKEYAHLRELLQPLSCPVFLLSGNHDDADAMRAAFADHVYLRGTGDLSYTQRVGEIELIALDTTWTPSACEKAHWDSRRCFATTAMSSV